MIAPEDRIPDEFHKTYSFNCLTAEEFKLLQESYEWGDELDCDCDDCGKWTIGGDRRCQCDNRRCYLMAHHSDVYDVYGIYFECCVD